MVEGPRTEVYRMIEHFIRGELNAIEREVENFNRESPGWEKEIEEMLNHLRAASAQLEKLTTAMDTLAAKKVSGQWGTTVCMIPTLHVTMRAV